MNAFLVIFGVGIVLVHVVCIGRFILREHTRMQQQEQERKASQERWDHIMRGDRPILWLPGASDEEQSAAIMEFVRGQRAILDWEQGRR